MRRQVANPNTRGAPFPTMPIDKQSSTNQPKPITPALSSNFRNVKSPLTPRLPGSTNSSPATTVRRDPFVRTISPNKEDLSNNGLNDNITPRSGVRRSRTGTDSPATPVLNNTTHNVRPGIRSRTNSAKVAGTQGLGIISPNTGTLRSASPPKSAATSPTPFPTISRRISGSKTVVGILDEKDAKFFRADEARSTVGINGIHERATSSLDGKSPSVAPSARQPTQTAQVRSLVDDRDVDNEKFFRANEAVVQATTKVSTPTPALRGQKSMSSMSSSRFQSPGIQKPNRDVVTQSAKPQRPVPIQPGSPKRKQETFIASPPMSQKPFLERSQSIDVSISRDQSTAELKHLKSVSVGSITNTPVKQISSSGKSQSPPLNPRPMNSPSTFNRGFDGLVQAMASPDLSSPRSTSLNSTKTATTSATSEIYASESTRPANPIVSSPEKVLPQSPGGFSQAQVDEASTARRERKVLDLEISNSSLLAINKTLERELRKQGTELRRFRRLSRSGRLSIAPTNRTASNQSAATLDILAEFDNEDEQVSDSDERSDLDEEDESFVSDISDSQLGPDDKLHRRTRDERRLILDLSKHQQMLIDSQKLSQSIRRCLTCTEDLIQSGSKALLYRVGIGDIKLGGRVLSHDELDERQPEHVSDEPTSNQGLLSPSLNRAAIQDAHLWVSSPANELQDSIDFPDLVGNREYS